jgi:hypothetical protein
VSINEVAAMAELIGQLIQITNSGQVDWTAANPTTYVWVRSAAPAARLTLQRVAGPIIVQRSEGQKRFDDKLVLQITDTTTGTTPVNISSTKDDEIDRRLRELFQTVVAKAAEKRIDFFKQVLS